MTFNIEDLPFYAYLDQVDLHSPVWETLCTQSFFICISWGDRNWVNYAKKRRPNEPCGTARVEWNPIASQNPIRSEYKKGDFWSRPQKTGICGSHFDFSLVIRFCWSVQTSWCLYGFVNKFPSLKLNSGMVGTVTPLRLWLFVYAYVFKCMWSHWFLVAFITGWVPKHPKQ